MSQRNAEGKGSTGKNVILKRAGEPAKLGADLDRASRAECLASEMQGERDKVKQGIKYAALFHEHQGELDDIGSLKRERKDRAIFNSKKKAARWQHDAAGKQEGSAYVCKRCGNTDQEHMKGKCRDFAAWHLLSQRNDMKI